MRMVRARANSVYHILATWVVSGSMASRKKAMAARASTF